MSCRAPRKNRYTYNLDGFERDLNYVDSTRRFATYTNLDPAIYAFRVKAPNNSGVWNEEGKSVEVVITPPWWKTV